jgi:hypothetical protein
MLSSVSLRPRSATEIVDAMFQLLRAHYPQLATIVAVTFIPQILLGLLLPEAFIGAAGLVAVLTGPLATGAVVLAVSDAYLGRSVDSGAALRRAANRLGSLVLVGIVQGVLVGVGLLLLIVPGFIFLAWTAVMPAVVVLEDASASDAFTRSRSLARDRMGHVLRTILVGGLIYLVGFVLAGMAGALLPSGVAESPKVSNLLMQIVQILLYPVLAVAVTLLYYDLRIRKEGFDIEIMASALSGQPVGAVGTAPAGG